MGYYIATDGLYYEGAQTHVLDTPVAPRPSSQHVFTGTPSLDPGVCWRTKTPGEIDAELDTAAPEFRSIKLAIAAFAEIAFVFIKTPSTYANVAAFKQAILQRYKEKIGNL